MAKSIARRCPAASSPPRISSGVALRPSGSFCPMWVWASNQSSLAKASRPSRKTGSRRWSNWLALTGTARLRLQAGRQLPGQGGLELEAQARQAQADAALRRPERDVRAPRDLVGRAAAPVGEHHGLALHRGKAAQRVAQRAPLPFALGGDRGALVGAPLVERDVELEPIRGAAGRLPLAPRVQRAAARHEPQVGAELAPARVVLPRLAPQLQEDVLHDVLRLRRAAQHAIRGAVDAPRVLVVGALEGGRIAEGRDALHNVCAKLTQSVEGCGGDPDV